MPELPEVETVRRYLEKNIINKKIKNIKILYKNVFPEYEKDLLINSQIIKLSRKGKFLNISLDNLKTLVIHFRMEGKLFYYNTNFEIDKHMHVIFEFFDNTYLVYRDVRKFGKILIRDTNNYLNTKPLNKLAPEPFNIDIKTLYEKMNKSSKPIKTFLLDQCNISGLGNIYVDEVLFYSKIKPTTITSNITLQQCEDIVKYSIEIFKLAIENKGSTISTFEYSSGHMGNFQNMLKMYHKDICVLCFSNIKHIKINSRGTSYCEKCQK